VTAVVIQFPRPCRPHPPAPEPMLVRILHTSCSEILVVADGQGWLHTNLTDALRDAVEIADGHGCPIVIDR
jgi:hypothetical protein